MLFDNQKIYTATVFDILEDVVAVEDNASCRDVAELFRQLSEAQGFAVLCDGKPVGIISRNELTIRLASQYGHAVYGKKSVSDLMMQNPLVVDVGDKLDDVELRVASGSSGALSSGFIVVDDGRYAGMGSALSIMQASVERTRIQNEQLAATSELAHQANKMKTQFLASMSHELRTPLNAIIGFSELIASEVYGSIAPTRYKGYAGDILESGKHLLSLINDILDMSKIEAGKYILQERPVQLDRLARNALKMCEVLAKAKNITLDLSVDVESPILIGDERAIKQMLLNLISNGIKYTPECGQVSVHIEACNCEGINILVKDTGIGIAENELEKVLEPFAQAENSLYSKSEGTGLGLAIVKAFAQLHNADFKLSSILGEGTQVCICFPSDRLYEKISAA